MQASRVSGMLRDKRVKYGLVICIGFIVDMGFAYALARIFALPLTISAVGGFFVGLANNYILFEFWAFRGAESRISLARASLTLITAALALLTRIAIIFALGVMLERGGLFDAIRLGAAAIASSVLNYLLVSRIVFRKHY